MTPDDKRWKERRDQKLEGIIASAVLGLLAAATDLRWAAIALTVVVVALALSALRDSEIEDVMRRHL